MPRFPAALELSSLDGNNGYIINGIDSSDRAGYVVSGAGDINNDGIDDFIIGASRATVDGNSQAGESYVVYGSSTTATSSLDLSALDGNNGFVISGVDSNSFSGVAVSRASDVNGDGIDDLIVGAYKATPDSNSQAGQSYVVFGSSTFNGSRLALSALSASDGYVINGVNSFDRSGYAVSSAGDVNNDGIADLVIGARDADPNAKIAAGASYVVYGDTALRSSVELSALDGNDGYVINGAEIGDRSGYSVSSAGDINGDGIDDVLIGAPQADPDGNGDAGVSYVVFGNSTSTLSTLDLSSLDGNNGFVINGINTGDLSGFAVSGAGDVNNDGIDDLIIGAQQADPSGANSAGESYVVYGSNATVVGGIFNLSALDGNNGFVIDGVDSGDFSGISVSGVGDINDDGLDDVMVGVYGGDPDGRGGAGESYVVYGQSFMNSRIALSSLNGINGFVINGIDNFERSGRSVSGAGDVNGDGIVDLIVGAYGANSNTGRSYVVFGQSNRSTSGDDIIDGIPDVDNTIDALAGNDVIRSANGNDTLIGNLGNDRVYGDDGNDELFGNEGTDKLYGGNGIDTLHGGNDDDILDGGSGNDILNGDLGNDTLLGYADNDTLNGGDGNDRLIGHEGDDILNGGSGDDIGYGNDGADMLNGDGGSDFLRGGNGNDTLNGGDDDDTLYGNEDADTINGGSGVDFLNGGAGDDTLNGGDDSDKLYGAAGNDTLNGDVGDDAIRGGAGDDILSGGEGSDVVDGGTGEDMLSGDEGNDFLYGYGDNDMLDGGENDDVLFGHSGNDMLTGGSGNDRLYGGAGDDILLGSKVGVTDTVQVDSLHGDGGSDTYVIEGLYANGGSDDYAIIRGFNKVQDSIQLSSNSTYTLGAVQTGTGIYNDNDLVAIIESHVVGSLSLSDSYFTSV